MVVADAFVKVVGHTRIENMFDSLFDQGTDMAVHQFGREANRIGWNGVLSFDVHFPIREGRGYHFKAEIGEEGVPKGEQFIHI